MTFPFSRKTPHSAAAVITRPTDTGREKPKRSCIISIGVSSRFTSEVSIAAKNIIANIMPPVISRKIIGSVMNMSGGPEAGSRPNANTAGMTTIAASMAASVSKTAMFIEQKSTFSFLSRYEP